MRTPKVIKYKGDNWEYMASFKGPMNAQKTDLKGRWSNPFSSEKGPWRGVISLFDHGSGVRIEGENISVELDYSQVSDIYHLLDAHNRGNDGWMWERYEATVREVKPRKSSQKKVTKKKAKKK